MSKKSDKDIRFDLIEQLLQDQLYLIDTRFKELGTSTDGKQSAMEALQQVRDLSELVNELIRSTRNEVS